MTKMSGQRYHLRIRARVCYALSMRAHDGDYGTYGSVEPDTDFIEEILSDTELDELWDNKAIERMYTDTVNDT